MGAGTSATGFIVGRQRRQPPTSRRQDDYIRQFLGAVADSTVLSTEAIQKAIDSCAVSGGGTVVLQPGYYQTGALFVKSGVNLQIGKGVTLLASPDIHHYPEFRSRIAGIEMTWPQQ